MQDGHHQNVGHCMVIIIWNRKVKVEQWELLITDAYTNKTSKQLIFVIILICF